MRTLALRVVAVPLVVLAAVALIFGSTALRAGAADHLDAPTVKKDGRIDINDVYVFQGRHASRTVLVMTVNPAAGLLSPTTFRPSARYEFKVDTGMDAIEDISLRVKFGGVRDDGSQSIHLYRAEGSKAQGSGLGHEDRPRLDG